jgi:hypothetical protein
LWVLINPDNVPVIENSLLHKLGPKTANYQAQDHSALHYTPLEAAPVRCSVWEYYMAETPKTGPLNADTSLSSIP